MIYYNIFIMILYYFLVESIWIKVYREKTIFFFFLLFFFFKNFLKNFFYEIFFFNNILIYIHYNKIYTIFEIMDKMFIERVNLFIYFF